MGLFSSWRQRRAFNRLSDEERNLVFYSESRQDWHHFAPIISRLTGELGRHVCYVTSDPGDDGLDVRHPGLRAFCIEEGVTRTVFFQMLRADVMVLTMMDLDNLELKRSINPVHYVYLFHSLGSTHMVDFAGSYDHYDTLLCAGPHHVREIRAREAQAQLPPKQLVECGYRRLEELMEEREARGAPAERDGPATVLLAPTWGPESTLNVCGEALIAVLLDAGYRVIMRPHYHTCRLSPELVARLVERFEDHPRFEHVTLMAETESLFESDLLISDWSAMSIEYALSLEKPVLFVDVPPRVRNPDYRELGVEPMEIAIRGKLGAVVDPASLADVPGRIESLLADPVRYRFRIERLREACVFNLGRSVEVAAHEIARVADEARARREGAARAPES